MKASAIALVTTITVAAAVANAGDDASGPISYSVDLGQPFDTYELTPGDRRWSASLVKNMAYTGEVLHFVRTSLPLRQAGSEIADSVYQAAEDPSRFYVVPGNIFMTIGTDHPFGPGATSMHSPASKNFIACLNCFPNGIPVLSGTPVVRGVVEWSASDRSSLE